MQNETMRGRGGLSAAETTDNPTPAPKSIGQAKAQRRDSDYYTRSEGYSGLGAGE